jgi:4-amino-4-deoxy-L-arabinose transferase-like glycosyltransferase
MAKVSPDIALVPFVTAMVWALVRLAKSGDGRWWLVAGAFGGLAMVSKFTAVLLVPAIVAFALVPDWRTRWLRSPYPYAAALIACTVFLPVVIWNVKYDWASFRFQGVRAVGGDSLSLRTFGEFIGLQFCLVGFVMLPVVLTGAALTAWRAVRRRDPVAILLSTAVIFPFGYLLWKSLTLRIGDTWPTFIWPIGFAAAAINLALLEKEGWRRSFVDLSVRWVKVAIVSGVAFVLLTFVYYGLLPYNLIGVRDPVGGEAGFAPVMERVEAQLQATGATWVATTDYRTYAMMRWFLRDRLPVAQINERGRYLGFRVPDLTQIQGHVGLYVGLWPQNEFGTTLWAHIPAKREPLERVYRIWRGTVMDTYSLERFTGWTPEFSPPPGSPLFRWRILAGKAS